MSRPTRELRIVRAIALLDAYDRLADGADMTRKELALALRLNRDDTNALYRNIMGRLGRVAPNSDEEWLPEAEFRVPTGPLPAPPDNLTPTERRIFALLTMRPGEALPGYVIHAATARIPLEFAEENAIRAHVSNLRSKGVAIGNKRGYGYWLEPVFAEATG